MHIREKRYRQSSKGKAKRNAAQKIRRANNTPSAREFRLKRYGITLAEFKAMSAAQEDKCGICQRPAAEGQHGVLRVDHCHTTNKLRGLLCHHCNVALGHFGDDVVLLQRAIEYLQCD